MNIQKISVEKLNPAAYNPRKDLKPGDKEYEKLKRSIVTSRLKHIRKSQTQRNYL